MTVPDDVKLKISEVCSLVNIDGLRGDLVINRTAKAYVALEGRDVVTMEDVERVVGLCLNHRLRKDPLDPIDGGTKVWLRPPPKKVLETQPAQSTHTGAPGVSARDEAQRGGAGSACGRACSCRAAK